MSALTEALVAVGFNVRRAEAIEAAILGSLVTPDAGDIAFTPAGTIAATNVQDAIEELDTEKASAADLSAHLGDTTDAHDASAISYVNSTSGLSATDAQAALDEIDGDLDDVEATLAATPWKWHLLDTRTVNGDEDFTGLAGYSEIRVVVYAVTVSSSGIRLLQASIDNGANWLTTSGDYMAVDISGVPANATSIPFHGTASTAARYGEILIRGFNLAAPKVAHRTIGDQDGNAADERTMHLIPTANALNAVRVISSAGAPDGGTIYLYGR